MNKKFKREIPLHPLTKYKICPYFRRAEIMKTPIFSETENAVTFYDNSGRRQTRQKIGQQGYEQYHDTWEQAREALLLIVTGQISVIKKQLDEARKLM